MTFVLPFSKKSEITRRSVGKLMQLTSRTLGNRFYNAISTSASVSTGRKSDQRGRKSMVANQTVVVGNQTNVVTSDHRGRKPDQCWSNFIPAKGENYLVSNPSSQACWSEIDLRPVSVLSSLRKSFGRKYLIKIHEKYHTRKNPRN
jgi:hypothetical protein